MSSRPAAIRIDDLAEPRFSAAAREMLDGMAVFGAGVDLDVAAIVAEARAQTALDDLADDGDAAFLERLRVLAGALEREGALSAGGRLVARAQLSQIVTNRLLAHDYVARHPELRDEPIVAPIVIVGLPRTGTTHLHNLMAADRELRSLAYWESLEPVPPRAEQPDCGGQLDGRRERCAAGIAFVDEVMPEFHRMHEMTVDHVHEEIQLLAIDASTMLFETTALVPSWRDYYRAHDQRSSYEFLRELLQVCQHQREGAKRWVLKSPQHLEQIPAVLHAFPDATVVFTHRDPVSVIASFATMAAYSARTNHDAPIDVQAIARYWCDRILDLYAACVRDRDLVPVGRSVDVQFDDFMIDDVAMVERIYGVAGLEFTGDTRAAMDAFMADHPRGKFGGVIYDLDQLGLDAREIRAAAAPYIERFSVPLEDRW
ncbi:MAG TPA: sulfotransferase [Acidimicrobiia bacterium]